MRALRWILVATLLAPLPSLAQRGGGGGGGGMRGAFGKANNAKKTPARSDPPQGPYTEANEKYPLKVEVLQVDHQSSNNGQYISVETVGAGNVFKEKTVGFDFKSGCSGGLQTGTYQSRWKKEDQKIELLTLPQGKTKSSTCTVDILSLKDKPYAHPGDSPSAAAPSSSTMDDSTK